ncbi:MAG: DNA translocase FtsK 4TM domain-containing protein, partial [Paludibacteraceae bacterium]|nr:DNA translocase FtsK 4TM domain-containing protein [Paludibacteraceae bacterium]
MAKKAKGPGFAASIKSFFCDEKVQFLFGIGLIFIGIFLLLAMISFLFSGGNDYSLLHQSLEDLQGEAKPFRNLCGASGAKAANLLINQWFGIASFTIPVFLCIWGYKLVVPSKSGSILRKFFILAFFTVWVSLVMALALPEIPAAPYLQLGGNHGRMLVNLAILTMGKLGLTLFLA